MSALEDLTAQVAANTQLEASAVQAIEGLAQQLKDAVNAGNDSTQLLALADQMKASAAALAAAIPASTPAAPPAPPPAPAPTP